MMEVYRSAFDLANDHCDEEVCKDPIPLLVAVAHVFGHNEEIAEQEKDWERLEEV